MHLPKMGRHLPHMGRRLLAREVHRERCPRHCRRPGLRRLVEAPAVVLRRATGVADDAGVYRFDAGHEVGGPRARVEARLDNLDLPAGGSA